MGEGASDDGDFPARAAEVPKLGRIEIVQNDFANHRALKLGEVLAYDLHAHLKEEPYGWSWAAVAFLDGHPLSGPVPQALQVCE